MNNDTTTETLVFDESGVAGRGTDDNGLFTTGGVAIKGNPQVVVDAWKASFAGSPIAKKKSGKLERKDLESVVSFIDRHDLIPISAHSRLTSTDFALAEERAEAFDRSLELPPTQPMKAVPYLWCLHMGATINSALFTWVGAFHAPIERIEIFIDQYELIPRMQDLMTRDFGEPFRSLLDDLAVAAPEDPHIANLRTNIRLEPGQVTVRLQARGPLGAIADFVASTYRRHLLGNQDATEAWAILAGVAERKYGNVKSCLGVDQTPNTLRTLNKPIPWIFQRSK